MTDAERLHIALEQLERYAQDCETAYQRLCRYGFHEDRAKAYLDIGQDLIRLIHIIKETDTCPTP